ncbi:unnamed protein product [Pylaiella littoralis]
MSQSTAEKSFHRFCDCFAGGLWHQWVRLPEGDDLKQVESIYNQLGFPGAVGSADCTYVAWEHCAYSEMNIQKGRRSTRRLCSRRFVTTLAASSRRRRGTPGRRTIKRWSSATCPSTGSNTRSRGRATSTSCTVLMA